MTPSLLPPNATPLERALEAVTTRVDAIPAPLRDLWNPDTCPASHLPWLAYALSIDSWSAGWSEPVKRSVIRQAIAVQRTKGSVASVRQVVEAFGGQIALREWWQTTPPGAPYTFDLVLTLNGEGGEPASAAFVEEVIDEVARTKPARAHFTFTQGVSAGGAIALAGSGRAANYLRLQLEAA